jgi:hypothetical protein
VQSQKSLKRQKLKSKPDSSKLRYFEVLLLQEEAEAWGFVGMAEVVEELVEDVVPSDQ